MDFIYEEDREIHLSDRLRQLFVISARPNNLSETLKYVEDYIPFIDRVIIGTPRNLVQDIRDAYQGYLKVDFLIDDEILEGRSLPQDHTTRNFMLRCCAMYSDKLDDCFLMYDDDYRPLVTIQKEDFIQDGRYVGYYFYDLNQWCGCMPKPTSYDVGHYKTLNFLKSHLLPTLQYSSHMPQIIDKRVYQEILRTYPGIEMEGFDEWSIYFNCGNHMHPNLFTSKTYKTLCWPGRSTDWNMMYVPEEYLFENFYEELYKSPTFCGISPRFNEQTDRMVMQKILRKHMETTRAMHLRMTNYILEKYAQLIHRDGNEFPRYVVKMHGKSLEFQAPKRFFSRVSVCNHVEIEIEGFEKYRDIWDIRFSYQFHPMESDIMLERHMQELAYGVRRASFPMIAPDQPGWYRLEIACDSIQTGDHAAVALDAWIYEDPILYD